MAYQLAYEEQGSGPAIILLHGNGEDRSIFQAQVPTLAAQFRVIAVDTRGHGQSPLGEEPFTLKQFAEDLHRLMDELTIEQADILGFSDGGNIALLFALRWPRRVRRLLISGANLYPSGMKRNVYLAIMKGYLFNSVKGIFVKEARPKARLFALMALEPHIRPSALQNITVPVLVMAGTQDIVKDSHTRLIAASLPNAKLNVLPGGHALLIETPDAFNQTVLTFLKETDSNQPIKP